METKNGESLITKVRQKERERVIEIAESKLSEAVNDSI